MAESESPHTPTMQALIDAAADSIGGANKNLAQKLTEFNLEDYGTSSQEATPPPPPAATSSSTTDDGHKKQCHEAKDRGTHTPKLRFDDDYNKVTKVNVKPFSKASRDEGYYKMDSSKHGVALIINNKVFKRLSRREGTDRDEDNLVETFLYLGYRVEIRRDCKIKDMMNIFNDIDKFLNESDKKSNISVAHDSFVCCILSHGRKGRIIMTADSYEVNLEELEWKISKSKMLNLKPKLFFIGCSRGPNPCMKPRKLNVQPDYTSVGDFYFCYASGNGEQAYRNFTTGTWFMAELCKVLCSEAKNASLVDMQLILNKNLANDPKYRFERNGETYIQQPTCSNQLYHHVHFFDGLSDHLEVYQKALKDGKTISLQYLKFFLVGIPRIGKTTTKLRLVEKMVNISEADECYKKMDSTTAAEWSYVKANLTTVTTGKKLWSIIQDEKEELLQLFCQVYKISTDDKRTEQHNVPPSVDPNAITNSEGEVEHNIPDDDEADTLKEPAMHIAESQIDDEQVDTTMMPDNIPEDIKEMIKDLEHEFVSADIKEIDLIRMLSVIDVGGQSAFLKMLPLLINGPALYSVFFSLMQHLDSPYYDTLVRDGKEYKPKRKTEATVKDVLIQILSSVALSNYQSNEVESELKKLSLSDNKVCATSFIIGTFKDRLIESVQDHESEINSIDKNIQKLVDEVFESVDPKPVSYAKCGNDEEKRLIFAIDNMNGTKKEIEELRDRLTKEMENKFANLEVPIRWLIFGILLRKEYEWVTISDCESLAQALHIKQDVRAVLWFFSVITGMFLYQPDIEDSLLSEVIICNQQMLFNSITELIEYPIKDDQSSLQSLTKHGQFSLETLEELFARRHKINDFDLTHSLRRAKPSKDPLIPVTDLVKLLEHRNVVLKISDKEYFMPAVLESLTEVEFKQQKPNISPPKDPCPLFIKFKYGYVPPGLFCAIMTKFVKEKNWTKKEAKCNFIKFKVIFESRPVNLMIMAHTDSYEICIWGCNKRISLKKLCQYINKIIDKAINEALCQEEVKSYELCIECPECEKLTVIKSDVCDGETVIICQNSDYDHDDDISGVSYTCWIYDQHCDSSPISTEANGESVKEPAEDGPRNSPDSDTDDLRSGHLLSDNVIPSKKWKMKDVHDHKSFSLQGKGTVIALIDSGVCTEYDLLSSKKIDGCSFLHDNWNVPLVGTKKSVPADCEHGTLTASIIGGIDKKGNNFGIAPEADLYVCKVLNDKCKVNNDDLLAALQHILKLHKSGEKKFDVVNMSLALTSSDERIEKVLKELTEEGVVLIAAAGNDGSYQRTPYFPASNSHVLAVGALNPKGDPSSSNPPLGVDVYLPGKDIAFPNVSSGSRSGSSCAAPMLAGLISLLIQWAKDKNGSEVALAKYHDVNFIKELLQDPALSDKGGIILRPSKFFSEIIDKNVIQPIKVFYPNFEDKPIKDVDPNFEDQVPMEC